MADSAYVVEVNEGIVDATHQGSEWWYLHRQRFVASGRLTETVGACIIGGKVEIGPYDKDDAEFAADHMVTTGGVPQSAVRVKRPAKAAAAPDTAGGEQHA